MDGKHCSGFGLATILMNSKPDIAKHYWSSYIIHIYVNCTGVPVAPARTFGLRDAVSTSLTELLHAEVLNPGQELLSTLRTLTLQPSSTVGNRI